MRKSIRLKARCYYKREDYKLTRLFAAITREMIKRTFRRRMR